MTRLENSPAPARVVSVVAILGVTRDFPAAFGAARVRALDDVTLRIAPGEVVGLLGPNGSGKTTLLKLLLGLLPPTTGTCSLFGFASESAAARRRLGFLGEAAAFPRFLTGRELIEHAARFHGFGVSEARERATELLAWAGLADAANRRLGSYSQGMRQRAGLAQALVHEPELLILDEPTTGLDPLGVAEFGVRVRDLAARGKTILLSSHHLAQVEQVCDRVVILNRGRVVADRQCGKGFQARDARGTAKETASAATAAKIARGELESVFLEAVGCLPGGSFPSGEATSPSLDGADRGPSSAREEGVASPLEAGSDSKPKSSCGSNFGPEPQAPLPKRKTPSASFAASLTRARLVAALTFREILRQRTPYLALFLAAAFVLGAQALRGFDFGRSELKFLAELGLGAVSVFTALLAVAVVAQSFAAELERGGATWQLATPLRRAEYVAGKLAGTWFALGMFLAVLLALLAAQLAARAFEIGAPLGPALFPLAGAAVALAMKLGVVLALTLLLASWVRAPLLVLGSGWLLVTAAHLQPLAQHAWSHAGSSFVRAVAAALAIALPNLAAFERGIGDARAASLGSVLLYGTAYVTGLLALTCLLFRRREL